MKDPVTYSRSGPVSTIVMDDGKGQCDVRWPC